MSRNSPKQAKLSRSQEAYHLAVKRSFKNSEKKNKKLIENMPGD